MRIYKSKFRYKRFDIHNKCFNIKIIKSPTRQPPLRGVGDQYLSGSGEREARSCHTSVTKVSSPYDTRTTRHSQQSATVQRLKDSSKAAVKGQSKAVEDGFKRPESSVAERLGCSNPICGQRVG